MINHHHIKIAILYHIFYEDIGSIVCSELRPFLNYNSIFLFNICNDTPGKRSIIALLKKEFPGCHIICTGNKGKDIGGKLCLLQLLFTLNVNIELIVFLHDKKSLHALNSITWKKDLLKIITLDNIDRITKKFEMNDCGIVATSEYIRKEPFTEGNFSGINGSILSKILVEVDLHPKSYSFVAGTMFWAKAKPFEDFFKLNNPLQIRNTLENGNVLDSFSGTVTHAWERIFSWIVTTKGLLIKGI